MNSLFIEYECGCTSTKKTDNQKCGNHWWAEAVQIVLNGKVIFGKIFV